MNENLIDEFVERLCKPDPSQVLILEGVYSASKWIKSLKVQDRRFIYEYMENELQKDGDSPIKESIVMVLKNVGGNDSIELLDKLISEGEKKHSQYVISIAKDIREFLSSYSVEDFTSELTSVIDEVNEEILKRKSGIRGDGTVIQLNDILNELDKLRLSVECKKSKNKKNQNMRAEYLLNIIFEFNSPLRRKISKLLSNYKNRM